MRLPLVFVVNGSNGLKALVSIKRLHIFLGMQLHHASTSCASSIKRGTGESSGYALASICRKHRHAAEQKYLIRSNTFFKMGCRRMRSARCERMLQRLRKYASTSHECIIQIGS